MTPLAVTATVPQQIVLRGGTLALDALLMAAAARRDRLPPPTVQRAQRGALPEVPIPVAKSTCGRVYLATVARPDLVEHETRYKQRRFPAQEALRLTAMTRVDAGAGPQKSYRIPYSAGFVADGAVRWWCLGDADGVRALLERWVTHLGAYTSCGYGRVERWRVEGCEPWARFPCVRDGRPLRPLPRDWDGIEDGTLGWSALMPPYWDVAREQEAWVP